ncbi:Rubredoxin, partial [Dysosmobacter welbionis]
SGATAIFKARPAPLNTASRMWWVFSPAICRMWRDMGHARTKARKNSLPSSVS